MSKIFKPPICEKCPVVKIDKGTICCGVCKELKASSTSTAEKYLMWKNCKIDWDKE